MLVQQAIVGLIVLACALQAAWALMPRAMRRRVLRWIGREPAAAAGCGSGCGGCSQASVPGRPGNAPAGAQPVVFHPRTRR